MPKMKERKFSRSLWQGAGIALILLLVVALLWYGNANSSQAVNAMMAQVYFAGEYQIADGAWQPIVAGQHIPATRGDVLLRGNFHLLTPDGEYIGIYTGGDLPIAFYTDHISVTFYEPGAEPFVIDLEDPLYGDSACGEGWTAHTFLGESEEPIQIRIHNPHMFGNETAVDEFLAKTAFWASIEFEKSVLVSGEGQRNTGLFFMIIGLAVLGIALFSSLIHIKNSKLLWLLGLVILSAGTYLAFSASGVSFWQESVVSNTTLLGSAMMLYMLFLSMGIVYFLAVSKQVGSITVGCLGAIDGLLILLPIVTDMRFYDACSYWIPVQLVADLVLIGCLVKECFRGKDPMRWLYVGAILPLMAYGLDVVMTGLAVWKGGISSMYVFMALFVVAMVVILRIIPRGINAATKARELETEKTALHAQLAESRISTMMSQIRPHFIYNTLGSIEQLCELDPDKAGELVHNFAKYLRGNFGELDNPRPIMMSQEMEHVRHYVSIENVRFPDITVSFEMNTGDFRIPALTIQPIVENAIKHGLMKLPRGGRVWVMSFETDTHYCVTVEDNGVGFDTQKLLDDRKHIGIRNIRERLKAMVGGTLELESEPGAGTKVRITIPKEEQR